MTSLPTPGQDPNWGNQLNTAIEERAVPVGGTSGQALVKQSGTDRDVDWEDVGGALPVGGTTGQVLTKQSGTDGDADWQATSTIGLSPYAPTAGMVIRIGPSTTAVPNVNQRLTLHPLIVTNDLHVDAFITNSVGTTGSGGTAGLYPSQADGTPDFSSGPLVSAAVVQGTTTTTTTFTAIALTPGIYWAAMLGNSTNPSWYGIQSSPNYWLPYAPAGWTNATMGYSNLSVVSLPSGVFSPTTIPVANSTGIPMVALRISSVP